MPRNKRSHTIRYMGTGAFTPKGVSGLSLWLDASKITGLADGDAVTTWVDQSGNGNNAGQAVAGNKPTYKTAIVNGWPVVRFGGADDYMATAASFTLQPVTIMAVIKVNNYTNYQGIVGAGGAGGLMYMIEQTTGKQMLGKSGVGFAGVSTHEVGTIAFGILALTYSAGSDKAYYLNGAAEGTENWPTAMASVPILIGSQSAAASFLDGDIAELVVYNSVLSTVDRNTVKTYLAVKYNITVV